MRELIKKLGSVGFTIFISITLIILLIVSTSMEAVNGTPFAQKFFYQTKWFDLLVSLLWVNIFCSTVLRFPFKKSQTGFLITHVAILGLLAGALISKTHGIEGQLTIFEGETADSIKQTGYSLAVVFPNQEETSFDLRKGDFQFALTKDRLNASEPFCPLKPKNGAKSVPPPVQAEEAVSFSVTDILEHASEHTLVKAGSDKEPLNHAAHVKIQSQQLGLKGLGENTSSWLVEKEPGASSSDEVMVGPVKIVLRKEVKAAAPQKPVLRVMNKAGQEILAVDLTTKDIAKKIVIAKTGLTIKDLEFYPYATVANNKLVNYPEGKKSNPAVVYNLVDAKGVATRQVRFAFFPDFESMHPGSKKADDVQIRFEAGEPGDLVDAFDGLRIAFFYSDNDAWRYQTKFQDKLLKEGEITAGQCLPSGWMDVEFCAQELLARAVATTEIVPTQDDQGPMAISVAVPAAGGSEVYWVLENKATSVHLPKGDVQFVMLPKTFKLPFSLALKQFRKIDYPGTMDPAAYESDVVLTDPERGMTMARTISMNHPLQYAGFKVFQSSYINDPSSGKASVFTVAKNPGVPWIYLSSIIACIGALFQFYGKKEKES